MRAKKVVITFVVTVVFVRFSWDVFAHFIPFEFGMLV